MTHWSTLIALSLSSIGQAQAHAGHGLGDAAHWHATDAAGFAVAVVALAALWWLGRGK